MTKRQKAEYHYHAYHEVRCRPNKHRDGAEVEAHLDKLPAYAPIMLAAHDTRCFACDQLIERGHTAFTCQGFDHAAPVLCYTCGIGWCIHSGSHRVDDFDTLPAIGGPVT